MIIELLFSTQVNFDTVCFVMFVPVLRVERKTEGMIENKC